MGFTDFTCVVSDVILIQINKKEKKNAILKIKCAVEKNERKKGTVGVHGFKTLSQHL